MDPLLSTILTGTIFDHAIVRYLTIKDIYNLSLVNRELYNKINEDYVLEQIKKCLIINLKKVFGTNYKSFIKALNVDRAVISGSFILQSILNEKWENSDIDIYINYEEEKNYEGYQLDKILMEDYTILPYDTNMIDDDYRVFDDIHSTRNYFYKNIKIQLVRVFTTLKCHGCMKEIGCIEDKLCAGKKQTLWDHVNNTGFEACKNMFYFNDKLNIQLQIKEYKQIINKCTVFTLLDTDDFYYRIEKYSKRGFYFKPKYNKLICLEYLLHKNKTRHTLKITKLNNIDHFDEEIYDDVSCNDKCPVKLLYRNIIHTHKTKRTEHYICINKNCNILNNLFQPTNLNSISVIENCTNLDQYAKIRNKLAQKCQKSEISIYNTENQKYDIQYGLPFEPSKELIKPMKEIRSDIPSLVSTNEEDWVEVKSRKKNRFDKKYGQLI